MTPERIAPGRDATDAGAEQLERRNTIVSNDRWQPFSEDLLGDLRGRLADYLRAAAGAEFRQSGKDLIGRCPFHDDSKPSLSVFADGKAFKCHACGAGGDVFNASQKLGRSGSFPEAVQDVARTLAVAVPCAAAPPPPKATAKPVDRGMIEAANRTLLDLLDAEEITAGDLPGISPGVIRAEAEGGNLGWHQGALAYVYRDGLKTRNREGDRCRFIWRTGNATEPWRGARIAAAARIVITEGESDCLAMIEAGTEDARTAAVAIPGVSGFRREWAELFKGKAVTLCFDIDEPGRKAAASVASMLHGVAAEVRSWNPSGEEGAKDARDILRKHGPEALVAAVRDAPLVEPPAQPEPEDAPEPPRFFYDGNRYFFDNQADFVPMDCASVRRHLKAAGFDAAGVDAELCAIQRERFVSYAGPLAGRQRGLHHASGKKLLATSSPEIVAAAPGEWQTLHATLRALLADDSKIQLPTFLGWLKVAREALLSGTRRPGQALALAGPVHCGKSLLIDLTVAALGGRRANPYAFFSGRTGFNGDLVGAEVLAVDDDAGSTDIRARKALAANIKSNLFAGAVRIEGKHREGFSFAPFWRMMIALNCEPENLLVLPPITEDVADKIILFKCFRRPLPMPTHTDSEKTAFWRQLMADLPGFLHDLERWKIPAELAEERCGVAAYHHPDILAGLHELSPEAALVDLIDRAAEAGAIELPWQGTAAELKGLLVGCHATVRDAEKLLAWIGATGANLGRLEGKGRVSKLTIHRGNQRWEVR